MPKQVYHPVGCLECRNTGYYGRAGVYEIMQLSGNLIRQITEQCELDQLRVDAYKDGMKSLRLSGAQKVAAGSTTVEEILRVTPKASVDALPVIMPDMVERYWGNAPHWVSNCCQRSLWAVMARASCPQTLSVLPVSR